MKKFWLFTVKITILILVILNLGSCRKDYFNNINSVEASANGASLYSIVIFISRCTLFICRYGY
jgi:hypothetical protein